MNVTKRLVDLIGRLDTSSIPLKTYSPIHFISTAHVKCWCRRKGIPIKSHPQSIAPKNKLVVLTNQDHRCLVQEGVCIFESFNSAPVAGKLPFELIGDPGSADLMSFWYKVQCCFCCKFLQFCLPKNNF